MVTSRERNGAKYAGGRVGWLAAFQEAATAGGLAACRPVLEASPGSRSWLGELSLTATVMVSIPLALQCDFRHHTQQHTPEPGSSLLEIPATT